MAIMQDITLTKAGNPNFPIVLKPQSYKENLGVWRTSSGDINKRMWLTATFRPGNANNGGDKVTYRLTLPVPQSVSAGCCVDNNGQLPVSFVEFTLYRDRTTPDDLATVLVTALQELVKDATIVDALQNGALVP
jgi:hypothetical protein